MRVVKAAQFGIQSALIGGAFVLLGGGALADTSNPTSAGPTLPPALTGSNLPQTNGNSTNVTTNGQGNVNVSNTTNTTTDQNGSNSQGGAVLNSNDQGGNSNTPTGTVSGDNQGPSSTNTTPNNQTAQNDQTLVNASPKLDSGKNEDTVTVPVVTESTPTNIPEAQTAPVVVVRTKTLKIQPVIVQAAGNDMAASLPSLPTPASAPVPPKPNSALSHLSAALADTIVPVFFFLIAVPVRQGLVLGGFATFIVLLLGAFISNYGLWLRRGGFATAARSDAPTSNNFSPFATPHFLGNVFAPPRIRHYPVFVVAEIKTGGYSLRGL